MTTPQMPPPHRVEGGWWVPAFQPDGSPGWNWEPDAPPEWPPVPESPPGAGTRLAPVPPPQPAHPGGPAPGGPRPLPPLFEPAPPVTRPGDPLPPLFPAPGAGPQAPAPVPYGARPPAAPPPGTPVRPLPFPAIAPAPPPAPPSPVGASRPRWARPVGMAVTAVLAGVGIALITGGGGDPPAVTQPLRVTTSEQAGQAPQQPAEAEPQDPALGPAP